MSNIPANLKYTKDHEWALIEGDTVTVGITDFAQGSLGDIVFVDMPEVGSKLEKGKTFGVVESIKSVSDLYSPVTGEVLTTNAELEDSPEQINNKPYESWFVKLKVESQGDLNELLSPEDYEKVCQSS